MCVKSFDSIEKLNDDLHYDLIHNKINITDKINNFLVKLKEELTTLAIISDQADEFGKIENTGNISDLLTIYQKVIEASKAGRKEKFIEQANYIQKNLYVINKYYENNQQPENNFKQLCENIINFETKNLNISIVKKLALVKTELQRCLKVLAEFKNQTETCVFYKEIILPAYEKLEKYINLLNKSVSTKEINSEQVKEYHNYFKLLANNIAVMQKDIALKKQYQSIESKIENAKKKQAKLDEKRPNKNSWDPIQNYKDLQEYESASQKIKNDLISDIKSEMLEITKVYHNEKIASTSETKQAYNKQAIPVQRYSVIGEKINRLADQISEVGDTVKDDGILEVISRIQAVAHILYANTEDYVLTEAASYFAFYENFNRCRCRSRYEARQSQ